jgi:hypothetical protein
VLQVGGLEVAVIDTDVTRILGRENSGCADVLFSHSTATICGVNLRAPLPFAVVLLLPQTLMFMIGILVAPLAREGAIASTE